MTVCHTGTKDIAFHTKRADVIIAAVGVAEFIKGDMISEGVAIIDVGVNPGGASPRRPARPSLRATWPLTSAWTRLPSSPRSRAAWGPMTITMLMKNTRQGRQAGRRSSIKKVVKAVPGFYNPRPAKTAVFAGLTNRSGSVEPIGSGRAVHGPTGECLAALQITGRNYKDARVRLPGRTWT